ncbi:MAG: phytoene/squalene synthase family protein, partial [Verrucomicrobiota bacterium]
DRGPYRRRQPMKSAGVNEVDAMRGPILRAVSRSFYLSLRVLPTALRDPLSLAYLLARATDTIADTPEPEVELRRESLHNLSAAIQGTTSPTAVITMLKCFAPLQTNAAERALIESLPQLLSWLAAITERDRREVRNVLKKINEGQTLDLKRFESRAEMSALASAAELEEYTYLVAGCVGEFWTRICFAHVSNFSERTESEMVKMGALYGKGLQLINILRDAGSDLRDGRCYFPAEELHSLGLTAEELLQAPAQAEPLLRRWREEAERGIAAGMEYVCAIRSRRVRFATALPALIGARTLALLREAGAESLTRKVKVSRAEVRKITSSTAMTLASRRSLQRMFRRLSS